MILTIILLCGMVYSCNPGSTPIAPFGIFGKWQLVKLESGWTGEVIDAKSLPYQESYEFRSDSTFRKFRTDSLVATGKYTQKDFSGEKYIELSFDNEESSSGCTRGKTYLQQPERDVLIENNQPCDGPKLYFQRVKEKKE